LNDTSTIANKKYTRPLPVIVGDVSFSRNAAKTINVVVWPTTFIVIAALRENGYSAVASRNIIDAQLLLRLCH